MVSRAQTKAGIANMTPEEKQYWTGVLSLVHLLNTDFKKVYADVEGAEFRRGDHLDDMCNRIQHKSRTASIGARSHSKSSVFYALGCWRAKRLILEPREQFYISSTDDMARYHTKKMRKFIEAMLDHGLIKNTVFINNNIAEIALKNTKTGKTFLCMPWGLHAKYRGAHPHDCLLDDILGEPTIKQDSVALYKAERAFKDIISKLPKAVGGTIHLMGNAQTGDDLHFQLAAMVDPDTGEHIYDWASYPAFLPGPDGKEPQPPNYENAKILWPEYWTRQMLLAEYATGMDSFETQFQCKPASFADTYFRELNFVDTDRDFTLLDSLPGARVDGDAFIGYDPGKSRHPAHAVCFIRDKDAQLWQVESKWWEPEDKTTWDDQLSVLLQWCKTYNVYKVYWDASREELKTDWERNALPISFTPHPLNSRPNKNKVATAFKEWVQRRAIHLFNEPRQLKHILSVDNNLKAPEILNGAFRGHGEAFWSVGMAALAAAQLYPFGSTLDYEEHTTQIGENPWEEMDLSVYGEAF